MKRLIPCLVMISFCASVSFGVFDYNVNEVYYNFQLELDNQSVLVESAGVKEIVALNNSYIEVQNTLPLQPNIGGIRRVDLKNTSSMKLIDGQVDYIFMDDESHLDVLGGEILTTVSTGSAESTVNFSGGYINNLRLIGFGVATLTGGQLDNVAFWNVSPSISVTFVCDLDTLNLTYDNGDLINATGDWLAGSSFDTDFSIGAFDEYIHFVPEPATMLLVGLGGLLIRRKK